MTAAHDFSNHHFLVADDTPFVRTLVNSILRHFNAENVEFAASGVEALNRLSASNSVVDCLLCDWNMSPINGLEVVSLIRRGAVKGAARDLRVIMLTSHAESYLVKMALLLDVNGYVVKPVTANKLASAIEDAFSKPFIVKHVVDYDKISIADSPSAQAKTVERAALLATWQAGRGAHKAPINASKIVSRTVVNQQVAKLPPPRASYNHDSRPCALGEVMPGALLARDLISNNGTLILVAGVPLTAKLIDRLKAANVLEPLREVWVSDA